MTKYIHSLIGPNRVAGDDGIIVAHDPATGIAIEGKFTTLTPQQADSAIALASAAAHALRVRDAEDRAWLLETIAGNLEADGDKIIARAKRETGLDDQRLTGELARTTGQLRQFASYLRDPNPVDIDTSTDLRRHRVALGTVAVFGASNFPLAFSAAGGDTAAALAAGCPVIVKAHPAHPGTSDLAAACIASAVAQCGFPPGTFSHIFGSGNALGTHLAAHDLIKAVSFTGSRAGGTALAAVAASRRVPIPVFAEMSAINPVIVLPGAAKSNATTIATGFIDSLTLGSGQFCTNPGVVFVPHDAEELVHEIANGLTKRKGQTMLTAEIAAAYRTAIERRTDLLAPLATGIEGRNSNAPAPALFLADAEEYRQTPSLQDEIFGAAAVIVRYSNLAELSDLLESTEGQLTVTFWADHADGDALRRMLPYAEDLAGRIILNGWPTGVAVTPAMTHGGPYPATSDSRFTAVGTHSIERFRRPLSYQGFTTQSSAGLVT